MRHEILDVFGNVTETIVCDEAFAEAYSPGRWRLASDAEAEPPRTWEISKRAFKNRFPRAKWNAASMASASNSLMYDFFETYRELSFVNLKDEETHYAVLAFSMDNIPDEMRLTGAEVDAVLNVAATPDELP